MTFNPGDDTMFLVGTDEGLIYKCTTEYSSKYLETYHAHNTPIYNIAWNRYVPSIFLTCAAEWMIKIWDLASGKLKLSLTGHVSTVRGLAVSPRHPYLFSCGEDRQVKCWDLEYNRVVRHYHGHLSGVHCLALHPTLDILVTGGRDSVARVWDMRTKKQIHALGGHTNAVGTVATNAVEPQV